MWDAVTYEIIARPTVAILRPFMYAMYALLAWSAMVAACGFAARHLDRDGPARRYLNESIFPVYILHQTVIVVLAHTLQPLRLAPGLEALVLVVLTLSLSFAGFELVRRAALLRPLFGLPPRGTGRSVQAAVAAPAAAVAAVR
jgi:surface polysaccharide O-acyltransferase-like enzyme